MGTFYGDPMYGKCYVNDCSSNYNQLTTTNLQSFLSDWRESHLPTDKGLTEEHKKPKGESKMNKNARGLYQVILVDPKEGKIIFNEFVICSKLEDVLLEADAGKVIKEKGLAVSEVDKIINFMGEIRKTKKNKDGIVELITEDEE